MRITKVLGKKMIRDRKPGKRAAARIPLPSCLLLLIAWAAVSSAENGLQVQWVNDGDTVLLTDGRSIRYIGINAPEVAHHLPGKKSRKAEPFGEAAREFNRKMLASGRIRLEVDAERRDRYGRTLAYVFLEDNTMINEILVRQGFAYCLPRPPNCRYEIRLLQAQRDAMASGRGLWQIVNPKGGMRIGNTRSKRFHAPECPFGRKMAGKNRIVFAGQWEAFYEGYAPCSKCSAGLGR